MKPTLIVGLRAAAKIANVSPETVRGWCTKYGIGRMKSGRWIISDVGLKRVVWVKSEVREMMDLIQPGETDFDHHD